MDYSDYLWIKFWCLIALAFFGNLIYSAITGRSLEQDRRDKAETRRPD